MADDHNARWDLIAHTGDIVSSFASRNRIAADQLTDLIKTVHACLTAATGVQPANAPVEKPHPAVPIRRSVTPDYLICLEDGKPFKSLKRHLRTKYAMSPEQYRAKWGLPRDYPMVAPAYAASRSALAKSIGLGFGGRGKKPGKATRK